MLKWNRRQFLSGLLTAASASTAATAQGSPLANALTAPPPRPSVPAARTRAAVTSGPSPALDDDAPHELQQLIPEGLRFGRWRIVSVLPVKLGAVPVVLESRRGERFQVDVLRRDRSTRVRKGLVETRSYALFLLNRGQGDTPTLEDHGLAVLWLAAMLRPREYAHAPVALLTQRERTQRFPRGKFNALVSGSDPHLAVGETPTDHPASASALPVLSVRPV